MNRGHIGFLMNQYLNSLEKRLSKAIPYKLSPLKIKCVGKKEGNRKLSFNDVSLIIKSSKIAKIKIKINNKTRIKELLRWLQISRPAEVYIPY